MEKTTYKKLQLKKLGLTYKKVAKLFNVSPQAVHITLNRKRIIYIKGKTYSVSNALSVEGRDLTREKVRTRDNHTCQKCGKIWEVGKRKFDVHHIDCDKIKTKKYENYEKAKHNLITLCHKCHLGLPEHRTKMRNIRIRNIRNKNKNCG